MTGELSAVLAAYTVFHSGSRRLIINTDSLGAITFVLRLAHSRWTFETWASEGVQDERVVAQMRSLTEAIREKRVLVKHVPGHTGHGLQESSDSVSRCTGTFPDKLLINGIKANLTSAVSRLLPLWQGARRRFA